MNEEALEMLRWFDEWIEEKRQQAYAALRQKILEEGFRDGMLLLTLPLLEKSLGTLDEATKKRIQSLPNQQIEMLCLTTRDFTTHTDLQQWLSENAAAA
jgi:Domain of unknown function (DUF4351)